MEQKAPLELIAQVKELVLQYRKENRYNQSLFAKKAGVSVPTIFNIENDKLDSYSLGVLTRMINACDKTLDGFIIK